MVNGNGKMIVAFWVCLSFLDFILVLIGMMVCSRRAKEASSPLG